MNCLRWIYPEINIKSFATFQNSSITHFIFLFDLIYRREASNLMFYITVCDPNAMKYCWCDWSKKKMTVFASIAPSAFDTDIQSFENLKKNS